MMAFAIKAPIAELNAARFGFAREKAMYGGKAIEKEAVIFIFASENEGRPGLIAKGFVTRAASVPKRPGSDGQTPRVNIIVKCTTRASRPMGRAQLKIFSKWTDGRPETELNFKLYRQATNKVVGISEAAARFLEQFFPDSGIYARETAEGIGKPRRSGTEQRETL